MIGDLDATSQAIGRLQVSVEKLEQAVERFADRLEELQRLRWLTIGGLLMLSGLSGIGGSWVSQLLRISGQ
ncbi:hypothetical protein [Dongia sp.]|uniref:hypothetical protein n=1 Tax=Dongia sp. TaxID=1977262 RepID=UPI0035AE22AE